jgi:hypothetical protein
MIPTSANSEHNRTTGRCFATRAESSFSLCSGVRFATAARCGGLIALVRLETKAGVKVVRKRRCKTEMI